MKRIVKPNATSVSFPVILRDTSSSTGGQLSGVLYNTAGLTAKYRRHGQSTWVTITLATKTLGTWTSGGFVADGSGSGGGYELDIPDAAFVSGADFVHVTLYGVTNMLKVDLEIEIDANASTLTRTGRIIATSGSTVTLDAGASSLNSTYVGQILRMVSTGECRMITNYAGATTKVATLRASWFTNPSIGDVYEIIPLGSANVELWGYSATNNLVSGRVDSSVGAMAANVITNSAYATGAISQPKFAAGAIDSAVLATDAIGSTQLATSAASKIVTAMGLPANFSNFSLTPDGKVTLNATQFSDLFSDADVSGLVNAIIASFDGAEDVPIQSIAAAAATAVWQAANRTLTEFGFSVALAPNQDVRNITGTLTGTDAIPAAAVSAAAVAKIQTGLATSQDIADSRDNDDTNTQGIMSQLVIINGHTEDIQEDIGTLQQTLVTEGTNNTSVIRGDIATINDKLPATSSDVINYLDSVRVADYLDAKISEAGGGGSIVVLPLTGIIQSGVNGTDITAYTKESKTVSIAVVDASGNAVDVEGLTLRVVIEDRFTADVATITDGSITKADNTVTFTIPNTATTVARQLCWSLRKTDETLLLTGIIDVVRAPSVDS